MIRLYRLLVPVLAALLLATAEEACDVFSSRTFLGSKTRYYMQQNPAAEPLERLPGHCKLVHINHLARHGTRHSTSIKGPLDLYRAFAEALRAGGLTPTGAAAMQWVVEFMDEEQPVLGMLAEAGQEEHAGIAARLWERHSAELVHAVRSGRRLVFESSHKARASDSRDAFIHGFAEAALRHMDEVNGLEAAAGGAAAAAAAHMRRAVDRHNATALASILTELSDVYLGIDAVPAAVLEAPADPVDNDDVLSAARTGKQSPVDFVPPFTCDQARDSPASARGYSKLRFFDTCAAFLRYKADESWQHEVEPYTARSRRPASHERAFLEQLFTPEFAAYIADVGILRYGVSADQARADGGGSTPQRLFPSDLVQRLYAACQIQASASGVYDQLCSLFDGASAAGGKAATDVGGACAAKAAAHSMVMLSHASSSAAADTASGHRSGRAADAAAPGPVDGGRNSTRRGCNHLAVMAKYEHIADLNDHHVQGAGHPTAYRMACVLLEDLLAAGDAGAVGAGSESAHAAAAATGHPFGHFRFAHSETVMPLLSLLGVYQDPAHPSLHELYHLRELEQGTNHLLDVLNRHARQRLPSGGDSGAAAGSTRGDAPSMSTADIIMATKHPLAAARLVPMAANVQWLLYDCGQGNQHGPTGLWMSMLHNERQIPIPACAHNASAALILPDGRSPGTSTRSAATGMWADASAEAAALGLQFHCPWEAVKSFYRELIYDSLDIKTCNADDWSRICEGVTHDSC